MKTYYIGMHHYFDEEKFKTDWRPHFHGIECCNLKSVNEYQKIKDLAYSHDFKIGIHYPLLESDYEDRDLLFNTKDHVTKKNSLEAVEDLMARVQYDPISYILIHFPKPMILDPQLSWHHANFPEHHVLEPLDISYSDFAALAYDIIHQLDVLASVYNIPIMLELELFNTYIYETDLLDSILKNCQNVFLCVDTARMHVIEQIDENFDAVKFMQKHKSYIKHIHVSNLQFDEGIQKGHQPAEEHLNMKKGWANIESMLIAAKNSDAQSLLYEHDSRMLSRDALEGVYNWIEQSME